jgi:hypothetical protein
MKFGSTLSLVHCSRWLELRLTEFAKDIGHNYASGAERDRAKDESLGRWRHGIDSWTGLSFHKR